YLSQDPYRSLPDPKYYEGQTTKDLRIRDSAFDDISSEKRIKYALEIEKAARLHSTKIISCTAGYEDSRSDSVKIHSNGFEGENSTTRFSAGAEATVQGDNGERLEDWYWCTTRFLDDMPSPKTLGQTAVKRALRKIGAEKLRSGKFEMILENRTTGRLFWAFYYPMQAQAIQQKNSFLEGKLSEKIGSNILTIIDDPFIESGLGSRLYDSDGLATRRRTIIEKGVLQSYYVDYYYGKKLGMEPTVGSSTNVVMDYGDRSMDEIVSSTDKGILVTGFIGGNCNSTTGDFSYGITGLYIENGQVVKPVGEMNIAGNMLDLWNNLAEVGNDPNIYSSWRLPTLVFKDVQFSGV
ncbi:MAG: TldD/PmbA family protein, partial [candidate division Zixibacteria bacterium]|nr:TldD/PmbA family protein [candidate division Zixibacteria bacterium]